MKLPNLSLAARRFTAPSDLAFETRKFFDATEIGFDRAAAYIVAAVRAARR